MDGGSAHWDGFWRTGSVPRMQLSPRHSLPLAALGAALILPGAAGAARPDLRVSRVDDPLTSPAPGGTVTLGAKVANRGKARARRSVVRFVLSADTRFDAADVTLRDLKTKRLRARRTTKVTGAVALPAGVGPGSYRVLACADAKRRVRETRERNNCRAAATALTVTATAPSTPIPVPASTPTGPIPAPAPAPKPATTTVYVATTGSDDAAGTAAAPLRTLAAGTALALQLGVHDLRVASGVYEELLVMHDGLNVTGETAATTVIRGTVNISGSLGVRAEQILHKTTLKNLSVKTRSATAWGTSAIGVRAQEAPGLVLDHVTVQPGAGAAGTNGVAGGDGDDGGDGKQGGDGSCDGSTPGAGGFGGWSAAHRGARGGWGGEVEVGGGWSEVLAYTGLQREPGLPGNPGKKGGDGGDGASATMIDNGEPGIGGYFSNGVWKTDDGEDGVDGADGYGGAGGAGGGGQSGFGTIGGAGNGGGGGGGGGQGGTHGTGGKGGGASFGVAAFGSPGLTIVDSWISSGTGGTGGGGGNGGTGGEGGAGMPGGDACPTEVGIGGHGGHGGSGADGGDGGGGAGGPSIALVGEGGTVLVSGSTLDPGNGGQGGSSASFPGWAGFAKDRSGV
jgi:hypothetical protein